MVVPRGNTTAARLAVRSLKGTVTEPSARSMIALSKRGFFANRARSSASTMRVAGSISSGSSGSRRSTPMAASATLPLGKYTRSGASSARRGKCAARVSKTGVLIAGA